MSEAYRELATKLKELILSYENILSPTDVLMAVELLGLDIKTAWMVNAVSKEIKNDLVGTVVKLNADTIIDNLSPDKVAKLFKQYMENGEKGKGGANAGG